MLQPASALARLRTAGYAARSWPMTRRLPGRSARPLFRSLLLSFLLLALFSGLAHAADIDAIPGFGLSNGITRYRQQSWVPLTVFVTGQGARGVGQMQVTVQAGKRSNTYIRRVPLRDGSLNEVERFVVAVRDPDPFLSGGQQVTLGIQLLLDGRTLAEKKMTLQNGGDPFSYNVLALTRDGSGMNFLLRKKLGLTHRYTKPQSQNPYNAQPQNVTNSNGVNANATLQVLTTDPRALPGMAQGYEMIDAVALGDLPLDTLAEEQLTALKQYVRDGGLLIVTGGAEPTRLQHPLLQELLPIVPEKSNRTADLSLLTDRYQQGVETESRRAGIVTGALKPNAQSLLASGGLTLIASRPYGVGKVVYVAFDPLTPAWRGWRGAAPFWRDLFRSAVPRISPRDLMAANLDNYEGSLVDALAGKQATAAPSLKTVSIFIGLYIFLLVPVSYLVLKKLDRRELTWVTAPLLIIGFTGVSYAIGQSIKGGMLTVNRAVVYEGTANSDTFAGYGQFTLYSPSRSAYDIAFGDPNAPDNPYRNVAPNEIYTGGYRNIGGETTVSHDKTTTIRNTLVRLWDKRSFELPVPTSLGQGIQAEVTEMYDHRVRVRVTNRTPYTLYGCGLLGGPDSKTLGELRPGQTEEEVIHWSASGSAVALSVHPPLVPGPPGSAVIGASVEAQVQDAIFVKLAGQNNNTYYGGYNQPNGGYGRMTNAFYGWLKEPTLDVRVNGKTPEGKQGSLVFVHLPVPQNASLALRQTDNPFLRKPILNLENESGKGQP